MQYVLDEHLRGALWQAIQRHNLKEPIRIEATRVGDPPDLPLGIFDPELLKWAKRNGRILVTADRGTMFTHFDRHLREGHHSPGVFMLSWSAGIQSVLDFLSLVSEDDSPQDWQDRVEWIR